jgi:hypothetical protein
MADVETSSHKNASNNNSSGTHKASALFHCPFLNCPFHLTDKSDPKSARGFGSPCMLRAHLIMKHDQPSGPVYALKMTHDCILPDSLSNGKVASVPPTVVPLSDKVATVRFDDCHVCKTCTAVLMAEAEVKHMRNKKVSMFCSYEGYQHNKCSKASHPLMTVGDFKEACERKGVTEAFELHVCANKTLSTNVIKEVVLNSKMKAPCKSILYPSPFLILLHDCLCLHAVAEGEEAALKLLLHDILDFDALAGVMEGDCKARILHNVKLAITIRGYGGDTWKDGFPETFVRVKGETKDSVNHVSTKHTRAVKVLERLNGFAIDYTDFLYGVKALPIGDIAPPLSPVRYTQLDDKLHTHPNMHFAHKCIGCPLPSGHQSHPRPVTSQRARE